MFKKIWHIHFPRYALIYSKSETVDEKTSNTAILAVTIMVAGLFAFAPIEQASTAHSTSIGIQQEITATDTDYDSGDRVGITCNEAFVLLGIKTDLTNIEADDIVDLHATEEGVFDTELVADVLAGETDEFFFGDEVPTTGFPTNTWVNFFLDTETDT